MNIIWKVVKGYPCYEISNTGVLRSRKVNDNCDYTYKIRKPTLINNKHLKVTISREGIKTNVYIANLVASHFIDNPNNYRFVRHKDNNVMNNEYTNLEWYDKAKEKIEKMNDKYNSKLVKITKNI